MDNFDLKKYLSESELFNESPQFIDKSELGISSTPELMDVILNKPTLTREETIRQSPKTPGVYFMYLTPEGVVYWEEILDRYFGSSSPINYCTKHNDGSILVYVGLAKGLNGRLRQHIKTGNLTSSTFINKMAPIFFPTIPLETLNNSFKDGFRDEFLKILDKSMRFNFLDIGEIDPNANPNDDYRTILEPIINKVEDSYIKGCVLYLNIKGSTNTPQYKYNLANRKKTIRLTESELISIVKRIIEENKNIYIP